MSLQVKRVSTPEQPRGGKTFVVLLTLLVLVTGCGKQDIAVYTIPKEPAPRVVSPGHTHAPAQLRWVTPEGWQEQPSGGMRLANYLIPSSGGGTGVVSVISLPGVVGQDAQVLNIFRERLPAPPLPESELAGVAREIQVGPTQGRLYDMTADGTDENRNRLTVAVLTSGNSSWYFNFFGPSALIEDEMPVFAKFLQSVTIDSSPEDSTPVTATAAPAAAAPVPGDAPSRPEWTVPGNWEETPPTRMLLSRFVANSADGQVEITVSAFPGEVGGTTANVNRWRGQIGLPPQGESEMKQELETLDVPGGTAILIDVANVRDDGSTRLIGVIWPHEGHTWFYKLVGNDPAAAREKAAFLKFVQSVRYRDA